MNLTEHVKVQLDKIKPEVKRDRLSHRRELLDPMNPLCDSSLAEFMEAINFSDNKDARVEIYYDIYMEEFCISIFKDEYLETEQEWKNRVEVEEKALQDWLEAYELTMVELAEKRRLETIEELEKQLKVLKGEGL